MAEELECHEYVSGKESNSHNEAESLNICLDSQTEDSSIGSAVVTLTSGVKLVVRKKTDSPVFAACLFAKDRCFYESPSGSGGTELLSRLLTDGSRGLSRDETVRKVNLAGTHLRAVFSLSGREAPQYANQFICVRIETTAGFSESAMEILSDTAFFPNFEQIYIEARKQKLRSQIREESLKPIYHANNALFRNLLAEHPYSAHPWGDINLIDSLEFEDLEMIHKGLFAPENLILSVQTCLEPDEITVMAEKWFGLEFINRMGITPPGAKPEIVKFPDCPGRSSLIFDKFIIDDNAAVAAGFLLYVKPEDEAAFEIACLAYTSCLAFRIRDREGLAYNISSGWDKTCYGDYFRIAVETGKDNIPQVENLIKDSFAKFRGEFITGADARRFTEIYKNEARRVRLASINRALYSGMEVIRGNRPDHMEKLLLEIEKLDPYRIMEVANRYFPE
jgi:predicted Zn-dependent peptidase